MFTTAEFRNGLKIEIDGEPFEIIQFQHVKPGKGVAFVKTRLKHLIKGTVLDKNFRAGDKVDKPDMEQREMLYLYHDGNNYYFMDSKTYEQEAVPGENIKKSIQYLTENLEVKLLFYQNSAINMDLPIFVNLKVTKTEPGFKGDTATGGNKPATLETGLVVQVPLFINEGDVLKIDTRSGEYIERASQ